MNGIWSLINGMQIIVYVPMFELLKFPANTALMNQNMAHITNFDIIATQDWVDPKIFDIGEDLDAFS